MSAHPRGVRHSAATIDRRSKPIILVLDHDDSFVHNLARYVTVAGGQTVVHRADKITLQRCFDLQPDGVVLSPGPKGPWDADLALRYLQRTEFRSPVLGVCLGHQIIAHAAGATVCPGPPMHGMADEVVHDARGLLSGCPSPMPTARYHSLLVDESSVRRPWMVTARNAEGLVMGVRHELGLVEGVQFHPESILSPHGDAIVANFVSLCRRVAR